LFSKRCAPVVVPTRRQAVQALLPAQRDVRFVGAFL
jgi:hypothetical protein